MPVGPYQIISSFHALANNSGGHLSLPDLFISSKSEIILLSTSIVFIASFGSCSSKSKPSCVRGPG